MTTTRRRRAAVVTLAALTGAVLGVGGTTLALWSDDIEVTGTVGSGYQSFAVGPPGATTPSSDGSAEVTFGPTEAERLLRTGEVAVPMQVDSVSQGNKGLRYEVHLPADWGDGVLAAAPEVHLFRVPDAAACTIAALPGDGLPDDTDRRSTPVTADYSTTTAPVTEYWCLYATLAGPPRLGEYENTATVSAASPSGAVVSAEDSWDAVVLADLDPADEPAHTITFSSTTFRPGEDQ